MYATNWEKHANLQAELIALLCSHAILNGDFHVFFKRNIRKNEKEEEFQSLKKTEEESAVVASILSERSAETLCGKERPQRSGETAAAILHARHVVPLGLYLSATMPDRLCSDSGEGVVGHAL